MQNNLESRYHIHSLAKGLNVLEALGQARRTMTLSEISERLGFSMSTAYRFLHTLESLGFVEKMADHKAYRITPKVLGLGYGAFSSSDLWQKAHPYLVNASREYGETFNVAILDGGDILYIDRVKTKQILTIDLEIGSKLPAYCTSMGRVLLAGLPRSEARRILKSSRLEKLTPRTIASALDIEAVLDVVARKGYAINDGEMALELRSVAAPVRDGTGKVVAALNMAVRASEYARERIDGELAPVVKGIALKISASMGYFRENKDEGK
ncbi:MAG: IclR family transcriptional regulator [Deltaproteobacteria bacterium CG_4_8_14_3_um_filter_51_11]|nr:MAG: IclR family transcriptional regulator [Deltaproteobacteria bacterium CG23_combo_of_CG06-09_8_20_14_all_51_20]PIX18139.1 MAG: IclR family transcriptional regulator [Deltaproteobacteria bacterium CG_4_8_14_3_um_filter_51_11]PIY27048.1 MAG: IclR family transcriptional regulator [Deltaproteobacteria bacterium CG_4_10_14_3_um_filter_51_14]PJB38037.1 MAG: IclR family transcriptional regulator [Deltaproteobacteria bacterium CG_4_9_14_3_um_filter_51_14]